MEFYIVYDEETKEYLESMCLWPDKINKMTTTPHWENAFRFDTFTDAIYARAMWRITFSDNPSQSLVTKQVVIKNV